MTISIIPACVRDVTWIAANMREQDRREIRALIGDEASLSQAAGAMLQGSPDHAFVATLRGEPVAAVGVMRHAAHLGSAWAFGTDKTKRVIPALTRWGVEHWKPRMLDEGFSRVEVRTIIDHDLSHQWLERLGFKRECIVRGYGLRGEAFVQFSFVRE